MACFSKCDSCGREAELAVDKSVVNGMMIFPRGWRTCVVAGDGCLVCSLSCETMLQKAADAKNLMKITEKIITEIVTDRGMYHESPQVRVAELKRLAQEWRAARGPAQ